MLKQAGLVVVNAKNFRQIRKRLGWSQVELGRRSGYSERVIRKAESGGVVRRRTLSELALTMSMDGQIVSLVDLT